METFNDVSTKLRSSWLIIFSDNSQANIRLQGGTYTPVGTDSSLFHVPDIYPGFQENFTFVNISRKFNLVEVQCFNGVITNSSFIVFHGEQHPNYIPCTQTI